MITSDFWLEFKATLDNDAFWETLDVTVDIEESAFETLGAIAKKVQQGGPLTLVEIQLLSIAVEKVSAWSADFAGRIDSTTARPLTPDEMSLVRFIRQERGGQRGQGRFLSWVVTMLHHAHTRARQNNSTLAPFVFLLLFFFCFFLHLRPGATVAPRREADPMTRWRRTRSASCTAPVPDSARLHVVATAPGRLVPQSQVKLVQAAEPGIVRAILVRDGDAVTAGQVLIRMDATVSGADAATLANELALKRLTVRAIDAALADRPLALDKTDPPLLYSQVSQQFTARRQALLDAIAQEDQAAARARHDRAAAQPVRDKLAATLPIYRQSAKSFTKLHAEGFVGELMANHKRRELIEREQDLKAQEATLQALDAAIAQSQSRITQLRSQFRSQLLGERVEAEAAVSRLAQETAKAGFRSQLLEVRAPVAGTVQGLTTTTLGAVVQAGAPLLTVVPQGDVLRAEAVLANDDIGFVQVGQRAKVKLAAYPFQKYGLLEGKVVSLSADAVEPNEAAKAIGSAYAAPQLAYKAVIELDTQRLKLTNGEQLKLTPGMAATIEIHQGRRTVMEYLLSPVQRVTSEAGRER